MKTAPWKFIFFVLAGLRVSNCSAQAPPEKPVLTFIQMTDAHVFDDGWNKPARVALRQGSENWEALHWAVNEMVMLSLAGEKIDFVVFTGDLGLQNVDFPLSPRCKLDKFKEEHGQPPLMLNWAAYELAFELQFLPTSQMYFLPGNNDVIDENITDSGRENCFVNELESQLSRLAPRSALHVATLQVNNPVSIREFGLLGLNTASFKSLGNYQTACSQMNLPDCPESQMKELLRVVHADPKERLLLFTHIPDLNDPFPGRRRPSWQIEDKVRTVWEEAACNSHILGIFAGHFHDANRNLYGKTSGSETLALNPCVAKKTWVSPPLALKFQNDKLEQARGFLLVKLYRDGKFEVDPKWYPVSGQSSKKDSISDFHLQLRIGEVYERAGRRTQAESAYRKALDTEGGPERDIALRNLERVLNDWGLRELWAQNRRLVASSAVTLISLACVVLLVWCFWRRKRRLRVYPLDAPNDAKVPAAHLERVAEHLLGLMRYYAAKTGPMGATKLPFIWPGFSEDLRSLLEQVVPGPSGLLAISLFGWLFRPEFVLRGTLAASADDSHIVLTLSRKEDFAHSWEKSVPIAQTHDALKDLVYAALLQIKKESR